MTLEERYRKVVERVRAAERAAGRPEGSVAVLAVGKTFPAETIAACAAFGQRAFGENYVQEAAAKIDALAHLDLEWRFIGPLQANKSRIVAERFDWVESVDRLRIAERLSAQRPEGMPPINVTVEVNLDGEATKSGVSAEELPAFMDAVAALPNLRLRGLMAIPSPDAGPETYARMRRLWDEARARRPELDTLSFGMSADIEPAVAAGSTQVRVGSAIFGARDYGKH